MKQVLTVTDASGLKPLELPAGLTQQEGDNASPPPSQDAVSRFQAAMSGPQLSPLLGLVNRPMASTNTALPVSDTIPGTGNGEQETGNVALPVSDTIPGTGNGERGTGNVARTVSDTIPGTGNGERGTGNVSLPVSDTILGTGNGEQGTGNVARTVSDTIPGIGNGEQGTGNSALPVSDTIPGIGNGEQGTGNSALPVSDTISGTGNGEQGTVPLANEHETKTLEPTNKQINEPTNKRTYEVTGNSAIPVSDTKPLTVKQSSRQTVKPSPKTDNPEPLQAAPIVIPHETLRTDATSVAATGAVSLEIDPASATARTQELVDAAVAVADTILVTPSLVHGEGEVTIRLRPTVLDGSEIRLEAKGEAITVALTPATVEVQRLAEQSQARFAAELSERIPSFQIAIVINPRQVTSRRDLRDETA